MTKEIQLTRGKVALVDDEDYEWLSKFKWHCQGCDTFLYAKRAISVYNENGNRKQRHIGMHRFVMNCPDGLVVDHINGNGLDNRKQNLRICTPQDNAKNLRKQFGETTSSYKGVSKIKGTETYQMYIRFNNQSMHRLFTSEIAAANAYNFFASILHGGYARLNDVPFMTVEEWDSHSVIRAVSGYRGVRYKRGGWEVYCPIGESGKSKYVGREKTEEDGARLYNRTLVKHEGIMALNRLNYKVLEESDLACLLELSLQEEESEEQQNSV